MPLQKPAYEELEQTLSLLTAQLNQHSQEVAVINSIQESLAKKMEIQAIYNLIGDKIASIFDRATTILITSFDYETNSEIFRYFIEKGERIYPDGRTLDKLRTSLIALKKKIILNNSSDVLNWFETNATVANTKVMKSGVFIPFINDNTVVGYISLQNVDEEYAFSDSDVQLLETMAHSMSMALENAKLFDETTRLLKETEQQKSELSVINSVQEGLAKELDINAIYELVGEKIRAIFEAQVIDIATYDSSTNLLEDLYSYEKGDRSLVGAWAPSGFRKHVIENGEVLVINKNLKEISEHYGSQVLSGEQPLSCVFVPLISGTEVKGMITLQDLDKENAFSESDVRLLKTVANSMTVALENARLFDKTTRLLKETEQQKGELAVINSVQEGLAKELDIDAIYELVGEKIREIFKAQVIDIATYDSSINMLDDKYAYEKGDRTLIGSWEPYGFRKHVIETGEVFLINENLAEISKEYNSKVLHGEQPLSCVFVPLISGNEVKGMITLQDLDKEHAFSESDVRLLKTVANSMTVALENARLFDKTNRLLKETEQRNAELAVINSVQDSLVSQLDIDAIYELVGEKMREIFNPQVIDIVTYDPNKNLIEDKYAYEKGDRTKLGQRQPNGFRKHVIKTGQVLVHNSGVAKAMQAFGNEILIGEVPKSQVYVPLMAGGKVMGVISLQNLDHENAFSESDVSLLTTLGNSMSVALESARLFDETNRLLKETEHRTAELAVINSVQEGLARELNIKAIYELVGERLRKLFPHTDTIVIRTFDYEHQLEHFQYLIEKDERFDMEPLAIFWASRRVIESKSTYYIQENFTEISRQHGDTDAIAGVAPKSAIFVPMVVGDVVKGTVSLQSVEKENAFTESDIRLITTVTNSMSVALENARLFDETNRLLKETEQRNAELAVINSVQEALVAQMNMEAIYELVGNRISELFDVQTIGIASLNEETGMEEFKYVLEKGKRFYPDPRPYDNLRKKLIQTKQKIYISNYTEEVAKSFGVTVVKDTETPKSVLFVPLLVGGEKSISYVTLQNIDREEAFSESDIRLLETLANSMSVALESARLFDETNRLLKETEQRTAELAVINSVQDGLSKELDIDAIYELVGNRMCEVFPEIQTLVIRTFDHENGLEHYNYIKEKGERFTVEPKPIIWANKQLISGKQAIVINHDFVNTAKKYGDSGVTKGEVPRSAVFLPMMVGDMVRGSISIQNMDHEEAFSESDIRLLTTLTNSMSVALENARLFDETNRLLKETEQRNAELAVINSVQENLVAQMNMSGIYELVGEKIREIFQAQVIDIVTFNKAKNLIEDQYSFEKGDRSRLGLRQPSGFRKHVIESKQTLLINKDVDGQREKYGNTVLVGNPAKSLVVVPMIAGGEVTGVITLQNLEKENAFSESDISLLTTLTNSMSVALESARLFDETNRLLKETEQRTAELAVINSVQEGLVREMNMNAIYELVGDRLCKLFPETQTLVIRTFDHETGTENWEYAIEKGERQYVAPRSFNWNSQVLIKTKKLLNITKDYIKVSKQHGGTGVTAGHPPKSAVFVPMMVGDVVKGSVSLQNVDIENAFSGSDIRLLTTLTNSMSVALENARLFDETNRLLKETEQRTAELAVINSVQEGLVREIDMSAIYETVGDRLCTLFNTQTVVIRTFDHKKGLEQWQYAYEKGVRQQVDPRPFNWNSQLLINTKKVLNVKQNYIEESKKFGGTGVTAGLPPKSAVFVPMLVGDVVRGSVSLQNVDTENAFSDSDVRLLTTLTNSMSVALENARLFDETSRLLSEAKQRASELATVNNISKALASQLDAQELIEYVGEQMRELFKANIVYLAVLNKKTNIINFPYQYGDTMEPLPVGTGLTSKIILTGEPLLVNKDVQEIRQTMGVTLVGIPAASYLGVPIPVGDEIIGVLSVQSTEQENRFNESDQRLLSTIAASVGVALKNANLFEEVKMAKLEAEAASNAAEKANEAKSAFLSTVSHELRTPLTSVLGFAKIIKKRLEEKVFPSIDQSDTKTKKTINQISENLNVVVSEGERLTHLINDVLDLAKIEAGKMEWNVEDVSLTEVAERAISATTSLFEQKNLRLEKEIEKDLPPISGDRDKLIQVMINLISNAVKFTEKGSVVCKVFKKRKELVVSVTDTGIGIAPEDYGAVFEQFKQVGGDTLTDKPKGTGLGLPICKEIVEHHGGRIWLDSKIGKGSTFSFALPLAKTEPAPQPMNLQSLLSQLKEQMAKRTLNDLSNHSTILIVDDDHSIRSLLHQELSDAGYLIEEAGNGREALDMIRSHKPDLIILDVMMPEMNGFDVAAILKNDPATMEIPIIMLSIVQDKIRGYRIGVDRYLNKPIDTALLFSEVGALLEQGKSKKKVMVVDEDSTALRTLTDVLETKGYHVVESNGKELMEKAVLNQPDIIILNSADQGQDEVIKALRFEKGMENVLFLMYQ